MGLEDEGFVHQALTAADFLGPQVEPLLSPVLQQVGVDRVLTRDRLDVWPTHERCGRQVEGRAVVLDPTLLPIPNKDVRRTSLFGIRLSRIEAEAEAWP